jgi:hypothetical protein
MADEIIRQGNGFTIYRTTDWGPAVPYLAEAREDSMNHGFLDLRDRPDLIKLVPEAAKSEGLGEILRALNVAGSPFMSLGCEHRLNPLDGSANGFTCYFHSYTDITYRDPVRHASEEQMIELADRFLSLVSGHPGAVFAFEIGIQRMRHFFGCRAGYNLSLGLSGYGQTEEQAAASYDAGAREAAKAFAELSEA